MKRYQLFFLGGVPLKKQTNLSSREETNVKNVSGAKKCFRSLAFSFITLTATHSSLIFVRHFRSLSTVAGTAGGGGGMWPNMLPEVSVHVKHRCHFRQWLKRLTSPFTASPRCKTSFPLPTATTNLNYKLKKKKYKNKVIMTIRGATAFFHTPKFLQVTIKWCHTCCFSLSPNKLQKTSFLKKKNPSITLNDKNVICDDVKCLA